MLRPLHCLRATQRRVWVLRWAPAEILCVRGPTFQARPTGTASHLAALLRATPPPCRRAVVVRTRSQHTCARCDRTLRASSSFLWCPPRVAAALQALSWGRLGLAAVLLGRLRRCGASLPSDRGATLLLPRKEPVVAAAAALHPPAQGQRYSSSLSGVAVLAVCAALYLLQRLHPHPRFPQLLGASRGVTHCALLSARAFRILNYPSHPEDGRRR